MKNQKIWFVTGASKGFGLEIAKAALEAGDKVIATVRTRPEQLQATLKNNPDLLIVTMDVTKEAEVKAAVEEGTDLFGKIDILVNNAGFGIVTAIEEASDAEVKKQYDTNVFGLLNVTRAILPFMRKQRSGTIINITSMFGYDVIPGWALYGSTKFAIEGISKGLAAELASFNIKVIAVAPGLFSTDFLSHDSYSASANIIEDYSETTGKMRTVADELHGTQTGDPEKLAQLILKVASAENPPLHLPAGKDSLDMYRANAAKTSAQVNEWEALSVSTDHETTTQSH